MMGGGRSAGEPRTRELSLGRLNDCKGVGEGIIEIPLLKVQSNPPGNWALV